MDVHLNVEERIKNQFPVLIVTLLSVLIGLDFSDLVGLMRARMVLWPLDEATLRTWAQIFAQCAGCAAFWILFAHIAVSRARIPKLADSAVVFLPPLTILFGNSLVGQPQGWPWFYFASVYLMIAGTAWHWQIRIALGDSELSAFRRLVRPLGPLAVIYCGIPFFAAAGWADSHGWLSLPIESLIAFSAAVASPLTCWIFIREWRAAMILMR